MLAPTLHSAYLDYKKDTNSVASWLASTAKECGYDSKLLHPGVSKSSGRLKGKARLQAKEEAATGQSTAPKYIIKTKDFVPLAKFLASKPRLSVPVSFQKALDRAIAARKAFPSKVEKHGANVDDDTKASHEHFVAILEKVREALKLRMPTTPAPTKSEEDALPTIFKLLEVHEPSEQFVNAPAVSRPTNAPGDKAIYEAEDQTSLADTIASVIMVLQDLNEIKTAIMEIWMAYRCGSIDLTAAAIATNTAIDIARKLTDEVEPLIDLHGGLGTVLIETHSNAVRFSDERTEGISNNPDAEKFAGYCIAETYYLTLSTLSKWLVFMVTPKQARPSGEIETWGTYQPNGEYADMSEHEIVDEDRALLMEFMTEQFVASTYGDKNIPVVDEFCRGTEKAIFAMKFPLWVVFAAQAFLAVHHVLRADANRAYETLKEQCAFFDEEIEEYLRFHKGEKGLKGLEFPNKALRTLQDEMRILLADPIHEKRLKLWEDWGKPVSLHREKNRVLAMSPVLSGVMLFRFRAMFYEASLFIANATGTIASAAHLYNAVTQEGHVQNAWSDMDYLRTYFGDSNLFVGGEPPKTMSEYSKKYLLKFGVSAACLTNKSRPNTNTYIRSQAASRLFKKCAPVSCSLEDRYVKKDGRVEWTAENIREIIDLSMWELVKGQGATMTQIQDPETLQIKRKWAHDRKEGKQQRITDTQEDNPVSLIVLVKQLTFNINVETFEFSFPYLSMHRQSWRVLDAIRQECRPMFRDIVGGNKAYDDKDPNPSTFVAPILRVASKISDRNPFLKAAEILNSRLNNDAEGRVALDAMDTLGLIKGFSIEEEGSSWRGKWTQREEDTASSDGYCG